MKDFALQPTVTQRVRRFLETQGIELRPWSSLDEVYIELYRVLKSRRDDPHFWTPLRDLLGDVVESAVDPGWSRRLPAPQAELLSAADLDDLAGDIRKAISRASAGEHPGEAEHLSLRRFTSGLSAAVLGGFLLLGAAAAGCSGVESVIVPGSEVDETPPIAAPSAEEMRAQGTQQDSQGANAEAEAPQPAAEAQCDLERSSALYRAIDESTLANPVKRDLCACFAGLGSTWSEGLTNLFERGSPEQIATAMERLVQICAEEQESLARDFAQIDDSALRFPERETQTTEAAPAGSAQLPTAPGSRRRLDRVERAVLLERRRQARERRQRRQRSIPMGRVTVLYKGVSFRELS